MAQLKDLYDQSVIDQLVSQYNNDYEGKPAAEPGVNPFEDIAPPTFTYGNDRPFSKVFWKPVDIPDIPVPMFKDTDWDDEARLHIPNVDPNWVWNRRTLEAFALAMYLGDTTLLFGLQGTGKSCMAEQWCAVLRIPFWRQSCNRETREDHFIGSPAVVYNEQGQMQIKQEDTMLTLSLKHGGLFCEDEAFRHNAALVLQSLREKTNRTVRIPNGPGLSADERTLKAPKGKWWYVLTDNTKGSGDETGIFDAEVQDASTLDRIDTSIEVQYLTKTQERAMLKKHCNLNDTIINGMIDFAKLVRNSFAKNELMTTMSVRGLLAWAQKIEMTGSIGKALQLSWANKLGTDDTKVINDMFHQVFSMSMTAKGVFNIATEEESDE